MKTEEQVRPLRSVSPYYFMGLASEEEFIAHLEKLKLHDEAKSKNQ